MCTQALYSFLCCADWHWDWWLWWPARLLFLMAPEFLGDDVSNRNCVLPRSAAFQVPWCCGWGTFRSHWAACALPSCSCNQCWASRSGPWIPVHLTVNSTGFLPIPFNSGRNLTGTGWTSCSSFGNLWLHERSEGGHDAKEMATTSTGSTKEKSVPYFLLFVPEFYLNIFIIHFLYHGLILLA